jgi:hypothetical protein
MAAVLLYLLRHTHSALHSHPFAKRCMEMFGAFMIDGDFKKGKIHSGVARAVGIPHPIITAGNPWFQFGNRLTLWKLRTRSCNTQRDAMPLRYNVASESVC